jgi:hypothetical protein
MPRPAPDPDRVRQVMAREAEIVEAAEPPGEQEPPPRSEPDALPEQLDSEAEPPDSDDPGVGPVSES